jgi:steroid delta-isomerase-like uncharacterized protein
MAATPEDVVRSWFEELWNRGDESTIDRLFASDGLVHDLLPDGQPMKGPADFRPFYRRFRGAFPDINVRVSQTVSAGDLVVAHCHVTGTHRGDPLGFPATNQRIDIWGFTMVKVVNGLIVEGWNTFDFLSMYAQLGVVQLPSVPAST